MGLTQEKVHQVFEYHPLGTLIRKKNNKPIPNYMNKNKRYKRVIIDGKDYSLHRVIFLYHYGYLPKQIDHIDGDRNNNKIDNLRESTQQQNCFNRKHHKNSKNKYKNVYKSKEYNIYSVQITVNGERMYFGSYSDIEEANKIAISLREKYHGEFASHRG